jgi:hypothetical protein
MSQPPTAAGEPEPAIHHQRQVAESFGADADRYYRTRPPYPSAWCSGSSPPAPVRMSSTLAAVPEPQLGSSRRLAARVLGVDPDARMAEFARRSGIQAEVSKLEDWDSAGREFDAVVAGTAWHWLDPVAGARPRRVAGPTA